MIVTDAGLLSEFVLSNAGRALGTEQVTPLVESRVEADLKNAKCDTPLVNTTLQGTYELLGEP